MKTASLGSKLDPNDSNTCTPSKTDLGDAAPIQLYRVQNPMTCTVMQHPFTCPGAQHPAPIDLHRAPTDLHRPGRNTQRTQCGMSVESISGRENADQSSGIQRSSHDQMEARILCRGAGPAACRSHRARYRPQRTAG